MDLTRRSRHLVTFLHVAFVACLFSLNACDDDPARPGVDTTTPAIVSDLGVVISAGAVTLRWTAPGDDGDQGQAVAFELRFANASFDSTTLAQTTVWDSLPDPGPAGTLQTLDIGASLAPGVWYFAIRTQDNAGNWSPWSEVLSVNIVYPPATTEDQLIENFVQAHLDRNFVEYDRILGDNFQFWFAPGDLDLTPNGFFWDRAADVASTERMFNGSTGQRPDATAQPAVQSISLTLTPKDAQWTDASGEVVAGMTLVPPGTMKRRYIASATFFYTSGDFVSQVDGDQLFYVVPVNVPDGAGGTTEVWQMLVWRDFGGLFKKSVEPATWGSVKARY